MIGHVETFSDDLAYVFHLAGIEHPLPLGTRMNSVSHEDDRTAKYLATLDAERLRRLHNLFQYDFELFGFDAHQY